MKKEHKERFELIVVGDTYFNDNSILIENCNVGTIYIGVNKKTISSIREKLIKMNYTTRIFIARINDKNNFYVYGKKKSNKGVFNQHCKNTVYSYINNDELYKHLIESSSNEKDKVFSDNESVVRVAKKINRNTGGLIE